MLRRIENVEEDRQEAAKEIADILNSARNFGETPELRGNADGTMSFHHPIDDVFALMAKEGMIKPVGDE